MSFKEDIERPFNLINFALAILGVGLGLYFYFFPRNDRGIAWIVEGPALIYDSKPSTSKLRLVDANNDVVKSDTYLVSYTVWNSGSIPIEPTDVRRPVRLILDGAERVLDFKIVKATDFEVGGFSLNGSASTNVVELQWKHLDPGKAVKVQVIFAQSSQPKPMIQYDIVGIKKLTYGQAQKNWGNFVSALVACGYLIFFGYGIAVNSARSKTSIKWLKWSMISLGVMLIGGGIYLGWRGLGQVLLMPTPPI